MNKRGQRLVAYLGLALGGLVIGGGITWLFSGPSSSVDPSVDTPDAPDEKRGGTLIVGLPLDPTNINPVVGPYAVGGWLSDLVTPGLARRVVGEDGLSFEPALAESWTWGEDDLSLTYKIRGDLSWDDGAPVTSGDVAFTYALISDPTVGSNWFGDAKGIDRVEIVDPLTVTFHFTERRNRVLQQGLTFRGIVPAHALADVDRSSLRTHPSGRRPVASGPFRVASWKPSEAIVLEPNPSAPADWRPHLDRIIFRIQPEANTRRLALIKGEIDLDAAIEPAHIAAYRGHDEILVVPRKAASMIYIGYNQQLPKWQDPKLRRALAHATDLDGIIERMYTVDGQVMAQPAVGTIAPDLGGWYNGELEPPAYDPELAARLLDETGWVDSNGNGIRDKDGEKLSIHVIYQSSAHTEADVLELVQNQWSKLGIEVSLESVDPTTFASRVRNKRYGAMLWGFGKNPKVDPTTIWGTDQPYNWFAYSNPEADRLLAEARAASDVAEGQRLIRELQAVIHADQPATFLVWSDDPLVRHRRFRDVEHSPFNVLFHAERWWVPADERRY